MWRGGRATSRRATQNVIEETFGADILHVHSELGNGNVKLTSWFGVEMAYDAIVNKRHQTGSYNHALIPSVSVEYLSKKTMTLTPLPHFDRSECVCR